MHRFAKLLPVALAACLSVAGSLPAHATDILWANVQANGTLVRGEGAITADRQSKGEYLVTFNRNVSKCNYQLSLFQYGIAFVRPSVADKNEVFIGMVTANSQEHLDSTFYLEVICKS